MRLQAALSLLLCLLVSTAMADHDRSFCEITQPSGLSLPSAPVAYTVSMSMQDDAGGRASATEYFDGRTQRTAFLVYSLSVGSFKALANFVTNQVQVVNNSRTLSLIDSCIVSDISPADVMVRVTYGSKLFYLPSKFFFGGGGINVVSDPTPEINNVSVNSFASCYYWRSADISLKLTWHFTKSAQSEPIRVVVEGKENNNGGRVFKITHSIIRFGPYTPDWNARYSPYMLPPGIYCRNLKSTRKPQTLPDRFSMRIERISLGANTATYLREAYDFKSNMSLLVGYPPATSGDNAKYGAGRLMYIHDFNRKLSYIRNEDMGNCTYERLTSTDWDSQKDGNQVRMRTPREFFDLDTDTVQYKGTGYTRDILTDIYINYKTLDFGSDLKFITTIEWYFGNRTVIDPDTNVASNQSYPLSVLVSSDASWIASWMYIYDFEDQDIIFNRHDISACFSNDAKLHVQIYFPLENDAVAKYVRDVPNDFTRLLIPILGTGLNLSPLRLLDPEVTVKDRTAILELTVTDKPKFQSNQEETPLSEVEAALNILVSKGNIFTGVTVGQDFFLITANKVTLIEERTNNLKSIGYTAGALVGIGFAMVVIGLALGVGVIFGIYKYRGGTLMGIDPFQPQRM